jgi:hypothetical protein
LVLPLGLAFGPSIGEDRPDGLLAEGVVRGDVQELAGGARLPAAELVNEGLAGGPREVRANDIYVDDVKEGIASLGELANLVLQGLTRLLFAAHEVPRVSRVHVRPLKIPNEYLFELCPTTDAVGR